MIRFSTLPGRALGLADSVGGNLKHMVPRAGRWLETGAKLGALKGGARVAGGFVRRHPAVAIATVAGAGLLWYAAHRRSQRAEQGNGGERAIEGSARRVDARQADESSGGRRRTGSASASGARKRSTGGARGTRRGGEHGSRSTTH